MCVAGHKKCARLACMVNDTTARETILKIADDYDRLAKRADERKPIR